jgi:hypothetical protein
MPPLLHQRFAGRTLAVATMHCKELAIVPPLLEKLQLAGHVVIEGLDTDRFGAFSGEVRRELQPDAAAEAKARAGAEASGMDLVIASEGSFLPYPPSPFIPCDEEWLVLVDLRDDLVLKHRHVSLQTVFGGEKCNSMIEVRSFAERMQFPGHALVLRPQEQWRQGDRQVKGIADAGVLENEAQAMLKEHGTLWLETDMRAMLNPTRMQVIGETAERFADELARTCPFCGMFWFRVVEARAGLPCAICGWPTQSTRGYLRSCMTCAHELLEPRQDGKQEEDPMYCDHCNP